jgi:hypothetical protein
LTVRQSTIPVVLFILNASVRQSRLRVLARIFLDHPLTLVCHLEATEIPKGFFPKSL